MGRFSFPYNRDTRPSSRHPCAVHVLVNAHHDPRLWLTHNSAAISSALVLGCRKKGFRCNSIPAPKRRSCCESSFLSVAGGLESWIGGFLCKFHARQPRKISCPCRGKGNVEAQVRKPVHKKECKQKPSTKLQPPPIISKEVVESFKRNRNQPSPSSFDRLPGGKETKTGLPSTGW